MLPCRWPLRIIDHDAAYRLRIDRTAKAAQIPGIAVAGSHQHVATDRLAVAMRLDRLDLPHLRQGRNPPRFAFHRTGTDLRRGVGIRVHLHRRRGGHGDHCRAVPVLRDQLFGNIAPARLAA